jgi:nucleoredoxin
VTATTTLADLVGPLLLVDAKAARPSAELLRDSSLLLLYFSAHWCPPCRAFTPVLRSFYKTVGGGLDGSSTKQRGGPQIVFVSSDQTTAEFREYYGKSMPWLALPVPRLHRDLMTVGDDSKSEDEVDTTLAVDRGPALSQTFGIRGIPSLIVLRREAPGLDRWLFVTDRGRDQVAACMGSGNVAAHQALLDEWMSAPAVSVGEASASINSGSSPTLASIFTALLRNPVLLLGLYYLVRYLLRAHSSTDKGSVSAADPVTSSDPGAGEENDSEF